MRLTNRGFPLFWFGRASSQFGDEITVVALPWLLAQNTSSPLVVGLLEAALFAPVLIVGIPLGVLADRQPRRRSMIQADLVRLAFLATVPAAVFLGLGVNVVQVLLVAFALGAGRILFEAASQAFLPDLIGREEVVRANGRLAITEGAAVTTGPLLAGVLISAFGASRALIVDAATFVLSAIALALVIAPRDSVAQASASMRAAAREGLSAIRTQQHISTLIWTLGAANVASGLIAGVLVFFLQKHVGVAGWQAGVIFSCNGIGALFAGILAVRLASRIGVARAVLVALASGALGYVLIASTFGATWFITATAGQSLVGFGIVTGVVASTSLRQRLIATPLIGRVTVTYRLVVSGAIALGAVLGGIVGETAGVRVAMIIGAVLYVAVALLATLTVLNGPDPQGVVTS